jgi:hypothetical protein
LALVVRQPLELLAQVQEIAVQTQLFLQLLQHLAVVAVEPLLTRVLQLLGGLAVVVVTVQQEQREHQGKVLLAEPQIEVGRMKRRAAAAVLVQ